MNIRPLLVLLAALALNSHAAESVSFAAVAQADFGAKGEPFKNAAARIHGAKPADFPALEAALLEAAKIPGATFACKRFVADMLRNVGSQACLPLMLTWLQDPQTADLALLALQGMSAPAIPEALVKELPAAKGRTRLGVLQALAARRDMRIIPELRTLAAGQDAAAAAVALQALGTIGGADAATALRGLKPAPGLTRLWEQAQVQCARQALNDGDQATAKRVWHGLWTETIDGGIAGTAFLGLVEADPSGALPLVVKALGDPRYGVAIRAARVAGTVPGAEATGRLMSVATTAPAPVQAALLYSLGTRGDRAALPLVATALASGDKMIQLAAISAAEALGDATVIAPLLALASNKDRDVSRRAQQTLANMKLPAVEDRLLAALEAPRPETIQGVLGVVRARETRKALPQLLKLATHPDRGLRQAALRCCEGLAMLADVPVLIALAATCDADDREVLRAVLWKATVSLSDRQLRFAHLWKAVPAMDRNVRLVVLPLAARATGADALAIVRSQIASGDDEVKAVACRTLFDWSDDSAATALVELFATTDQPTFRTLAARALASQLTRKDNNTQSPAKRQEILRDAMTKARSDDDRKALEWAIAQIGKK